MVVKCIEDASEFQKIIDESGSDLVVVHFAADWAPQCKQMNDVIIEMSKDDELNGVNFLRVETESLPTIALKYDIKAVPTFIFFRNKQPVHKLNGANVPEFNKSVRSYAKNETVSTSPIKIADTEDLNTQLKKLINAAACMLFMKGNAKEPKCGFSRQMISILDAKNAQYSTFDILTDEAVRQGLKEYSKWPTYPQLYINGELIGGLDIVKEMLETGDLDDILIKKDNTDERQKKETNSQ